MKDYYKILGVPTTASQDDIKRAFRKLASLHHPDKGGNKETFQEIQEAYNALGDPEKRASYDNPHPRFHGQPNINEMFDIFRSMGGNPFGGFNMPQRNRNLGFQTVVSLEDAFNGKNITISVKLPSGKEQLCELKIPNGIQDGTTLRLSGMGDDSISNLPRGDIHLTVHVHPHSEFQRDGDDLIKIVNIDAFDAILGKSLSIETISNQLLEVKIQPGTQPGATLSIPGHGMPKMSDPRFLGRLLLKVNVKIPTDLSDTQLQKLKELIDIK